MPYTSAGCMTLLTSLASWMILRRMYCSHADGEQFILSGKQNCQPSAISRLATAVQTLISSEQLVLVWFSSGPSNSGSLPPFSREKGHRLATE